MIEPENFIEKQQIDFNENNPDGFRLHLDWKKGKGERFSLVYAGGEIRLKAESASAAIFGMSLLKPAALSGHLTEFLGDHTPKFPLRALWIRDLVDKIKPYDVLCAATLCQKVLLLGYNTLILELPHNDLENSLITLEDVIKTMVSYGLKIAVKIVFDASVQYPHPSVDAYDHFLTQSIQPIVKRWGQIAYIYWDAKIYAFDIDRTLKGRSFLHRDLALLEVKKLEKALVGSCRLIYALPAKDSTTAEKQSLWIATLCKDVSQNTIIGFSSCAGNSTSDHLPPHPVWELLRREKGKTYANLLPLVNVGLIGQGEGLWPTLTLDLVNRYLMRCDPSLFSGALLMTAHIPKEEALLSCSLWTAAHTLWGDGQPALLAETWFGAYFPDILRYKDSDQLLEEIRQVSISIGHLNFFPRDYKGTIPREEYRILTDSLLARLRVLQMKIEAQQFVDSKKPCFKDYFNFFVRDARRLILRFLQQHQMPMVNVLNGDDMLESFWTAVSGAGSQGWNSGMKVLLREEPHKGEPGSAMARIYEQVIS